MNCISQCISITGATGLGIEYIYTDEYGYLLYQRTDGVTGIAGNVLGPTGYTGSQGPTGLPGPTGISLTGPTGLSGEIIEFATVDSCCNLILITNKNTYTAGPISCCTDKLNTTGATGPTGLKGASITQVVIDTIGNLTVILSDGTRMNAGNYRNLCPTGPQGPTGKPGWATNTGPTGPSGVNGFALSTGPTGPTGLTPTFITDANVNATGNLIFTVTGAFGATGFIDAGNIMGPTGPTGTNPLGDNIQQFQYYAALVNILNMTGYTGTTSKTITIPVNTYGIVNNNNPPINQILVPNLAQILNLQGAIKPGGYFALQFNSQYNVWELRALQNMTCQVVKAYSWNQVNGSGTQVLVGIKNIGSSSSFPIFADNPYANPIEYTTISLISGDRLGVYPMTYSYSLATDSVSTVTYGNIIYAVTKIYN